MATFTRDETVKFLEEYVFGIEKFHPKQIELIEEFCLGKNIYLSAHTGFGKSIIYQGIPWFFDCVNEQCLGVSTLIVVSPLISLMEDQVKYLKEKTPITAVAIHQKTENLNSVLDDVEQGFYSLVFTSPESMLSKVKLRQLLSSSSFQEHCIGVAIDEAHVMAEWGFADFKKKVFRKYYANLVQLRTLLGDNISFALFTATASRLMELKIFESLGLTPDDFTRVLLDPDRKNIYYQVQMVPKVSLSIIFAFVIQDIVNNGDSSKRRLIYCQTRKRCALLFNMFTLNLGQNLYSGAVPDPRLRRVDMFHGGTPDSVKSHILDQVTKQDTHLRVVICTIAFGMGVNCRGVNESIHFGPSKSITSFVQESGRIGRNGEPSISRLFYTSALTSKVDAKMRDFVQESSKCRRNMILSNFSASNQSEFACGCECCDVCALKCECPEKKWNPIEFALQSQNSSPTKQRVILDSNLDLLRERLITYKNTFLEVDIKPVGIPSPYMEFDDFQIRSIIKNATKVFTVADVYFFGFVWRREQAIQILKIFGELFEDIEMDSLFLNNTTDFYTSTSVIGDEWYEIANDPSLADTLSDSIMLKQLDDSQDSD